MAASGKLDEKEKAEANRSHGEREDQPASVFLEPGSRKYPVKVRRDGEWHYDRDLLLAAAREARMHGHEELAERADAIRKREFGGADDMAFDLLSVRRFDEDGRLHVETTPISKAVVNEYYGREIPGAEKLGLQPDRKYRLLRHPDELKKGAETFNNIPLMIAHVRQSADDPQKDKVVGSLGTDSSYEHPYLKNSLVIWDKDAIEGVQNGSRRQLSCSYRYDPDMTPGTWEGQSYDGVMRNIRGNHTALVQEGRAGSDVLVQDSLPPNAKDKDMATKAKDNMEPDEMENLEADKKAKDAKRAKDAEPGGEKEDAGETERLKKAGGSDKRAKDSDTDEDERKEMEARAKDKKRARDEKEDDKDEDEEEDRKGADRKARDSKRARDEKEDEDEEERRKKERAEDRAANDEAIKRAIDANDRRHAGIREAERFVRPWVGDLHMAFDSAEGVYRKALEMVGVDVKGKHPDALKDILAVQPKPGDHPRRNDRLAHDAAAAKSFGDQFPDSRRIRAI